MNIVEKSKFEDGTKKAVAIVVSLGIGKILAGFVDNNVRPTRLNDRIAVVTAASVLGFMLGDLAIRYTNDKVEEIFDWWNINKSKFRK